MKKCKSCYLRDSKPCYECSACARGDDHYKYYPTTHTNADREKLEREKGCRYCQDKSYKQKGYYIDDPAAEIVGINHYCINCGKRLEVEQDG